MKVILTGLFTRDRPIRIGADPRTRGIRSTFTILPKQDAHRYPLLSIVQRIRAIDEGFTSLELYVLLAAAVERYLACPSVEDTFTYEVRPSFVQK
jgi:hypothetical protein